MAGEGESGCEVGCTNLDSMGQDSTARNRGGAGQKAVVQGVRRPCDGGRHL